MAEGSPQDRLRRLPSVDRVIGALPADVPSSVKAAAARGAIADARRKILTGDDAPTMDELVGAATATLAGDGRRRLQRVINATGVLVHTNLGRVPLGGEQIDAAVEAARSYSSLEYDLESGDRGDRLERVTMNLVQLTGAEAGLAVNNNAAAVLLAVAALCAEREVIISRGELVEIGAEFRIPDVMGVGGATLVEVGTTNRTHLRDYEEAITPSTAAILKVHPSNYRVVGFASSVDTLELARLARGRGLLLIHDLGSGRIGGAHEPRWSGSEPPIDEALEAGADVVTFSGDKLLGGPQAGIAVGRTEPISAMRRHALARALRVDKMTLAALEATLRLYLEGRASELPLWTMAAADPTVLERRARALATAVNERCDGQTFVSPASMRSLPGGGSLPGTEVDSWGLTLVSSAKSAAELQRDLRSSHPPIVARIEDDVVLLDLRTVSEDEDRLLEVALSTILRGSPSSVPGT